VNGDVSAGCCSSQGSQLYVKQGEDIYVTLARNNFDVAFGGRIELDSLRGRHIDGIAFSHDATKGGERHLPTNQHTAVTPYLEYGHVLGVGRQEIE